MNLLRKIFIHNVQRSRHFYRAAITCKDVVDNPFYEKYKSKLVEIPGIQSHEPYGGRDGAMGNVKCKKVAAESGNVHVKSSVPLAPPPNLDEVMKVELIRDKSSEDISKIWLDYHRIKDCISATIPAETYLQLNTKSMHCPMYVYPLPHNDGYEMWLSQFNGQRCYFTSLMNYQRYQENAPYAFVLTHYTEFLDCKGIVLVHGEVDIKELTTLEAQNLTNQMHLYYASQRPDLYAMVYQFNHDPQQFDYKKLIENISTLAL